MYYNNMDECITEQIFRLITHDEFKKGDFVLTDFKNENIHHFGYVYYDSFNIIKLDKYRDDKVLRCKNGSNDFIIKYQQEYYVGSWNEAEYDMDYAVFQLEDLKYELTGCTLGSPENVDLFINELQSRAINDFRVVSF